MIKNRTLSVIIPVYNEAKTIGPLIRALTSFTSVDELICIDDGSKDDTYHKLKKYDGQIKLIHFPKNKGKGYALYKGVSLAQGEIIVFCDSDIVELNEDDIKTLVQPLLTAKTKMVLGQPRGNRFLGVYLRSLTGERAFFKKDIYPVAQNFKSAGLGVETYINSVFKKSVSVRLHCRHLEKFEKCGSKEALASYIKEGLEIVRERAKVEGFWSNEIERQLKNMTQVKTWKGLAGKVKGLKNTQVRHIFEKYVLAYAKRLKSFLIE